MIIVPAETGVLILHLLLLQRQLIVLFSQLFVVVVAVLRNALNFLYGLSQFIKLELEGLILVDYFLLGVPDPVDFKLFVLFYLSEEVVVAVTLGYLICQLHKLLQLLLLAFLIIFLQLDGEVQTVARTHSQLSIFKFLVQYQDRMIKQKYMVKFTNTQNDNGTVWFTIDVYNPKQDQHWSFKQRFSFMRELHLSCEKSKFKKDLPVFPPRKLFGGNDQPFIQQRKKALQNYYNTLLKSINIDQLPQMLQFFNTNKPKATKSTPTVTVQEQKYSSPPKTGKKDKQAQLKKIFEEIVAKAFKEMVESNQYDTEIEDDTRRKFNQEFQKLKLDLRSPLIDQIVLPKGDKQNDTDFWSAFFHDSHEDTLKKLNKLTGEVDNILKESNKCGIQFVVPL